MKLSTAWINQYLEEEQKPVAIVDALERSGIEVEQVTYPTRPDKNIVVALVKKVAQHPNADRLWVAIVDDGSEEVAVVCGAPVLNEGMRVALARPGSVLPDGTTIKSSKIRGETSNGMLCSPLELGLSSEHNGLYEVPNAIPLGRPVGSVLPTSAQLDVKTAANRQDLQSALGLAREVAAQLALKLRVPEADEVEYEEAAGLMGREHEQVRRLGFCRMSVDLAAATTPDWMKNLLSEAGIRSINPVVDVTNFVMIEMGQPLHAYDGRRVEGMLQVRRAKAGERLVTLDGKARTLGGEDLVVADEAKVLGLAGVMGGSESEVNDESRTIILEAASFDGATVRKTALRHGLRSEASARFERGVPVQLVPLAMARAVQLLEEIAGARVEAAEDQLMIWPWTQRIGLRCSYANKLIGLNLSADEIVATLRRVGIEARPFDISAEARRQLGKPYVLGASFRKNGTDAFDCSYLVDYLYSLIGRQIGFTALGQYELGRPVELDQLKPGDVVFYEGIIEKSATDHYFTRETDGSYRRHEVDPPKRVGHNGLYIGAGRVIMAARYAWNGEEWTKLEREGVVEVPLETFTENPGFLGARRFVEDLDDYLSVPEVPWWRQDVKEPADLVEELVRLIGYEHVKATLPPYRPSSVRRDLGPMYLRRLRESLYGLGLYEVYTYSFVSRKQLEMTGLVPESHLKLANPLSLEQEYLRTSVLPSLLATAARNDAVRSQFALYEVTSVFCPRGHDELPDEPRRLALLWRKPKESFGPLKGALDAIGRGLNVQLDVEPGEISSLVAGRSGRVVMGQTEAGVIGQVSQNVLDAFGISGEASFLELDLDLLLASATEPQVRPVSKYPGTQRDITLLLHREVTWRQVRDEVEADGLAEPEYRGEYSGEGIPEGKKSLTVRLSMRADDHTLTDSEASGREKRILARLEKALGATLRS